jgi:hypothetical protein
VLLALIIGAAIAAAAYWSWRVQGDVNQLRHQLQTGRP